jgi:hypothetical protein
MPLSHHNTSFLYNAISVYVCLRVLSLMSASNDHGILNSDYFIEVEEKLIGHKSKSKDPDGKIVLGAKQLYQVEKDNGDAPKAINQLFFSSENVYNLYEAKRDRDGIATASELNDRVGYYRAQQLVHRVLCDQIHLRDKKIKELTEKLASVKTTLPAGKRTSRAAAVTSKQKAEIRKARLTAVGADESTTKPAPALPAFTLTEAIAVDRFIQFVYHDTMWLERHDSLGSDLAGVSGWSELCDEWDRVKTEQKLNVPHIAAKVAGKSRRPVPPELTTEEAASVDKWLGYVSKRTDWRESHGGGDPVYADHLFWDPMIDYWCSVVPSGTPKSFHN